VAKDIIATIRQGQARSRGLPQQASLALVQVRLRQPEEIDLPDYLSHTAADV